jgi:hypothetical protein
MRIYSSRRTDKRGSVYIPHRGMLFAQRALQQVLSACHRTSIFDDEHGDDAAYECFNLAFPDERDDDSLRDHVCNLLFCKMLKEKKAEWLVTDPRRYLKSAFEKLNERKIRPRPQVLTEDQYTRLAAAISQMVKGDAVKIAGCSIGNSSKDQVC